MNNFDSLTNNKKKVMFDDNVTIHSIKNENTNDSSYFDSLYYTRKGELKNTESNYETEEIIKDDKRADETVNLINTFLKFYKIHYDEELSYHMFKDINPEDETNTNRCIEMFQKYIDEYQNNSTDDRLVTIYEIDDLEYDFHLKINYVLTIKNKASKVCHSLLVLIKYIISINESDWIIDIVEAR